MNKKSGCYCAVANCRNKNKKSDQSFFRFPKDVQRAKEWAIACGRSDLFPIVEKLYYSYRICGSHFERNMFYNDEKKRLLPKAIPTKFPISKSHNGGSVGATADIPQEQPPTKMQILQHIVTPDGASDHEEVTDETVTLVVESDSESRAEESESETPVKNSDSWSSLETSALIRTYGEHMTFSTGDGHDLIAWDRISADLISMNVHKTPESCESRWNNLFQIYSLNKRDPERINFAFYDEIDEIIGQENIEEENKKHKRHCDCSDERRMLEKNRRHRERMELTRKKLDVEKRKLAAFEKYLAYLKAGK